MVYQLKNDYLCLDIEEPGSSYLGSRFDWTGQITQITYLNKHTFCTTESLTEELRNKQGRGLCNEFGIDQALGYNDCKVGGKFIKIGVGLLTKETSEPYNFSKNYKTTPFSFWFSFEDTKAHFYCMSEEDEEFSFMLKKRIELSENKFTVYYTLLNQGKHVIKTNEYVHNFLSFNKKNVNENYKMIFPFKLNQEKMKSVVNPQKVMKFGEDFITWNSTPNDQFFIDSVNTDYKEKGKWTLINTEDKVGIQEVCDFNIQKINLWGCSHVVSPEIFVSLNIAPHESFSWSRTFTVFTLN